MSASILASSITRTRDVSIVSPSASIWLCLEGAPCSGILHIVEVPLVAFAVVTYSVESIESHPFTWPFKVNDIAAADLQMSKIVSHLFLLLSTHTHAIAIPSFGFAALHQQQPGTSARWSSVRSKPTFIIFFPGLIIWCFVFGSFALNFPLVHLSSIVLAWADSINKAAARMKPTRANLTTFPDMVIFKRSTQLTDTIHKQFWKIGTFDLINNELRERYGDCRLMRLQICELITSLQQLEDCGLKRPAQVGPPGITGDQYR